MLLSDFNGEIILDMCSVVFELFQYIKNTHLVSLYYQYRFIKCVIAVLYVIV